MVHQQEVASLLAHQVAADGQEEHPEEEHGYLQMMRLEVQHLEVQHLVDEALARGLR